MYLKDIKLDIKGLGFNQLNHRLYNPLLQDIRDVEALTLHGWMFKEVFGALLSSQQDFRFSNFKHLWWIEAFKDDHDKNAQDFEFSNLRDLWWIDTCMEDHDINALFGFLKYCNSLKRLFISIDTRSYTKTHVSEHKSTIKVQKGQLCNLKVVKMEGFKKEAIMLFKERLMKSFDIDPRVIEVRKGMYDRCLLKIPKGQANAKGPESKKLKFCYKLVEEVDHKFLCCKHPHMP